MHRVERRMVIVGGSGGVVGLGPTGGRQGRVGPVLNHVVEFHVRFVLARDDVVNGERVIGGVEMRISLELACRQHAWM